MRIGILAHSFSSAFAIYKAVEDLDGHEVLIILSPSPHRSARSSHLANFARLFLKLADQLGQQERGGVFIPLPLARQELADLTGTTIETAIRIMSRWGKDDVLRTEKDGFVLIDRATLETLAAP